MNKLVPGRVIARKYRLDRTLATGGMGSVWAAWNAQLEVPVAIKFMAAAMAGMPDLVARFQREAKAAAQIRCPQVVQIFEHGIDQGLPYIVMERLDGEDLGTRLKREQRLSVQATARIIVEICKALHRAHELGIIHRDLKPANIFLASSGDDELVKVLDFGIAKVMTDSAKGDSTKTGEIVGTPNYMSPEQVRCPRDIDHRSDLWSVGIIAFRALTASLPFPNEEVLDMLVRVCREPAPPPSSFASDLGPEVDGFFAQALAIAPDDRFQSAREMAAAMRALAGPEAPPSSTSSDSPRPLKLGPPPLAARGCMLPAATIVSQTNPMPPRRRASERPLPPTTPAGRRSSGRCQSRATPAVHAASATPPPIPRAAYQCTAAAPATLRTRVSGQPAAAPVAPASIPTRISAGMLRPATAAPSPTLPSASFHAAPVPTATLPSAALPPAALPPSALLPAALPPAAMPATVRCATIPVGPVLSALVLSPPPFESTAITSRATPDTFGTVTSTAAVDLAHSAGGLPPVGRPRPGFVGTIAAMVAATALGLGLLSVRRQGEGSAMRPSITTTAFATAPGGPELPPIAVATSLPLQPPAVKPPAAPPSSSAAPSATARTPPTAITAWPASSYRRTRPSDRLAQ